MDEGWLFQKQVGPEQLDTHKRQVNPDLSLMSHTNFLNMDYRYKCKAIQLLGKSWRKSLELELGLGKAFLDLTPKP